MAPFDEPIGGVAVDAERLTAWASDVVRAVGTPDDIAIDVADVLVAADLRGIASHGSFRLPVYVSLIEAGVLDATARPTRIGGTRVISLWDSHDGWGPHAARVLMDDTIERASELGLAASVTRHASHFGIAGWYAMRAARRGMIGIATTNTSPLVAPTGGRGRILGTNPIAFAAPAGRHGMFVLDMATSGITWGRVLVAARRGTPLPAGVAVDGQGRPSTDPDIVLAEGALLPLGGLESTAGYKGYGLAVMVDILTGVLAGANFGSHVVPFSTTRGPSDLGQLFLAIDPVSLGDGFEMRMEMLLDDLRATSPAGGSSASILFAGEPEAERERLQRRSGVVLGAADRAPLVALGERLGIPFPSEGAADLTSIDGRRS